MFKVFGIQLSVHASFFLLPAYAGYEGWQDSGLAGLLVNVAVTVLFFICVILHEFGHSLTAQRFGVRVPRILLLPIGGMAEFDRIPRQPSQELLITLAGPAVNFVIFAALAFAVGLPARWWSLDTEYPATLTGLAQLLATWNLAMGCFNLLPVFPMDGGRIFRALLATRRPYLQATSWAVTVGKLLALIAAALSVFYFQLPLTALLFLFIIWAGHAEYQHTLRRDEETRYYAAMAQRLAATPPPEDEPRPPLILHGPN